MWSLGSLSHVGLLINDRGRRAWGFQPGSLIETLQSRSESDHWLEELSSNHECIRSEQLLQARNNIRFGFPEVCRCWWFKSGSSVRQITGSQSFAWFFKSMWHRKHTELQTFVLLKFRQSSQANILESHISTKFNSLWKTWKWLSFHHYTDAFLWQGAPRLTFAYCMVTLKRLLALELIAANFNPWDPFCGWRE